MFAHIYSQKLAQPKKIAQIYLQYLHVFPSLGEELRIVDKSERVILCKKFGVWKNVYKKMQKTDFTLVFGEVEVGCHKHVLAAASSVFEAMVETQLKEAIESRANIELSEEVGRAFLRFIYTGELEERMLEEHTVGLLELGDKYDV